MRHLTLAQVLELHRLVIEQHGGAVGLRDLGALESAVAQPRMTFDGVDLYESLAAKAAALAHSLIQNHPFVDGNKRAAHASMEMLLVLNGYELDVHVDEQEEVVLSVASGRTTREEFILWVAQHLIPHCK